MELLVDGAIEPVEGGPANESRLDAIHGMVDTASPAWALAAQADAVKELRRI